MIIRIQINKIIKFLLIVLAILFLFNAIIHILKYLTGHNHMLGLFRLFDFYSESNFPTWYSTILLAVSSTILYFNYFLSKQKEKFYWLILAFIFLFLSVDEFAQLHELIGSFLNKTSLSELLPKQKGTWVFYGAAISIFVGIVFFNFWLKLEEKIRHPFLIAALIYIGGALGFEIIEIFYAPVFGHGIGFDVLVAIEETMEMFGIIVFIYALLEQIVLYNSSYKIHIR